MGKIGHSTDVSTESNKLKISGTEPASFRYNNPGAQNPSRQAALFGQLGYGIIGGGNTIAAFPSPVNGAACNFELLNRVYTGMSIGAAGTKWTGAHGFGIPGFNANQILTKDMLDDPVQAIALLKAIAHRESGRGNNLTEQQWAQAHRMFKLGSADAFLAEADGDPAEGQDPADNDGAGAGAVFGPTGAGLVRRARQHIGERYENILVPKNDAGWDGPWDCAEFVSWLVYQEGGILYGCTDDGADPAKAEAYTGAWKSDLRSLGTAVSIDEAASTPGGILLRYPPGPGRMGHIAVCDGKGGTVEAKGRRYGVVAGTVDGRAWDAGVLVPGFSYNLPDGTSIKPVVAPTALYRRGAPNMAPSIVTRLQQALAAAGFDPGLIDGDYGPDTEKAVIAFQTAEGLTVDGVVGPETAGALGVTLTAEAPRSSATVQPQTEKKPVATGPQTDDVKSAVNGILPAIIALFLRKKTMTQPAKDGDNADAIRARLINALQASLSGDKVDVRQVILTVLSDLAGVPPARTDGTTPATPAAPAATAQKGEDALVQQLIMLLDSLLGTSGDKTVLGPVNGALGETIGNLLNGRKSAIGIIGAILTSVLSSSPVGGALSTLVPALSVFNGSGSAILSIFLGIATWGILGKGEKWKDQLR